jgi:hypothetical protein
MDYHLELPNELRALERKFLLEIENLEKQFYPYHAPTSTHIIEKKIAFLKETLGIIEANPRITLDELADLVDYSLGKNVFETDKIFASVRILGWIKYMIIEKNGRVPRHDH